MFLNEGDRVIIEEPGYLGAIQAFSFYGPEFRPVPLQSDGIDAEKLSEVLETDNPRLFYTVPNFQNPSGVSYTEARRRQVAQLLQDKPVALLEDDPYGELRFMGRDAPAFKSVLGDQALLLGSFSKTVAPSLRLGWVCGASSVMEQLIIPKQAADLHTNYFCQKILFRYLKDNDVDAHIRTIRQAYREQRDAMVATIESCFPQEVTFTKPDGGMFLWVTLPAGRSTMELFDKALEQNVAFVPGSAFHVKGGGANTLRLNYSNVDVSGIGEGIARLGRIIKKFLNCASR